MVEYDTILKHYLSYDNDVLKIHSKLLLEYLNCKIKTCYEIPNNTHLDYEKCKGRCGEKMVNFEEFKRGIYHEFNTFYLKKFIECSKEQEDPNYFTCIESTRKQMDKNVNEIKKIFNEKSKLI